MSLYCKFILFLSKIQESCCYCCCFLFVCLVDLTSAQTIENYDNDNSIPNDNDNIVITIKIIIIIIDSYLYFIWLFLICQCYCCFDSIHLIDHYLRWLLVVLIMKKNMILLWVFYKDEITIRNISIHTHWNSINLCNHQ